MSSLSHKRFFNFLGYRVPIKWLILCVTGFLLLVLIGQIAVLLTISERASPAETEQMDHADEVVSSEEESDANPFISSDLTRENFESEEAFVMWMHYETLKASGIKGYICEGNEVWDGNSFEFIRYFSNPDMLRLVLRTRDREIQVSLKEGVFATDVILPTRGLYEPIKATLGDRPFEWSLRLGAAHLWTGKDGSKRGDEAAEFAGTNLGDSEGHLVRVRDEDGLESTHILDSYGIERSRYLTFEDEGRIREVRINFSDYRSVDDRILPHEIRVYVDGELLRDITIDGYRINPLLHDWMFESTAS